MKRWLPVLSVLALCSLTGLGCDEPTSVAGVGKPPPSGGGGPREIAFLQTLKEGECIRAMAVDGSNVATIHCRPRGSSLYNVSWEPAGTAVAYTVLGSSLHGLWRVNVDGTNVQHLLTEAECGGCADLAWSPQGNQIAVIRSRTGSVTAPAVLLVPATGCPWPSNPSDPCPRVLHSDPDGFSGLAWSPDGTQLAVGVRRGSPLLTVLVEPGSGPGPGTVTVVGQYGSVDDWGRGQMSTTLALQVNPDPVELGVRDIYFFDLSSPEMPPQLVVNSGRNASFSPDGEFIVYRETSRSALTVKLEVDTGTSTSLIKGTGAPDWRNP